MATQRPGGSRPQPSQRTSQNHPSRPAPHRAERPAAPWDGSLSADTAIWNTRGLQTESRLRAPVARRTPSRQLPPSPVPRLILWAVLIGAALVCFQAVKHLL